MNTTLFDTAFLKEQKQILSARKEKLEEDLAARGTKKASDSNDYRTTYQEYGDDEESNAAEYAQTETNLGVVEKLEDELKKVSAALGRIESGTYGVDIKSGKPIRIERLKANPAAETDIILT